MPESAFSGLTLIGQIRQQVGDTQRKLVRIGIDYLAGAAIGEPSDLAAGEDRRSYPIVSFDAGPALLGRRGSRRPSR